MKANNPYNEKLISEFFKLSDEERLELLKPYSAQLYEELQKQLQLTFIPCAPKPKKAVIEGWVARDSVKNFCLVHVFDIKPKRDDGFWKCTLGKKFVLYNSFPQLKWEDEPKPVKIEVSLINKKR